MSLLLDALKKAADDKQKISRGEVSTSKASKAGLPKEQSVKSAVSDKVQFLTEELSLQPTEHQEISPETLSVHAIENSAELTLDIDENVSDVSATAFTDMENSELSNSKTEVEEAEKLNLEKVDKDHGNDNSSDNRRFTISDEALSMLIYKTNRDVKKGKTFFVVSVLMASLTILVSGGVYYYMDMQAEIVAIERKHQIAMQSMRSKTSGEKTPEELKIIRNLVSDAELDEKVQYAKNHIASKKNSTHIPSKVLPEVNKPKAGIAAATPALSIEKINKTDPVGEKLDAAWLAYNSGNYNEAKELYKEVLNVEGNNRDALLGLGAIAVIEKDGLVAREIYLLLLKQDPRDPIATAALASLHGEKSSLESDKEYLLSMIRKNPDAPHLNFSLANIYAQQNKWKSAQQYYFNAWQYDNENADYIFNLAVSMDQLSKQQQAINFYKDSLVKSLNKQVSFSRKAVQKRINELSEL